MSDINEACWDGYQQIGMKEKNGKMVPNCVPIKEFGHKRLDSPRQQDSDINNDGKIDVKDDYLRKRRELSKLYKKAKSSGAFRVDTTSLRESDVESLQEGDFCPACLAKYVVEHVKMIEEAEYQGRKVKLGKPMRGDVKKFKVFVKDPKTGNIKKVNFGDPNMKIKKSIPGRRKSFRARHKCHTAKDRTSARYWSCKKW